MPSTTKCTVLISGCSDGGTGSALAKEFHARGLRVYATARNVSKMQTLASIQGIELLALDISSPDSIADCVKRVPELDILVNNAGTQYTMPISDLDIAEAKKLFDANVWGHIAITQAFLPLLLRSEKGMVVNHTSVGAGLVMPLQAAYNASKAAMATFSDTLRLEMENTFGIKVVQLRTGGVKTNIITNSQAKQFVIPEKSIWAPVRERIDDILKLGWAEKFRIPAEQWAKQVVGDLLKESPAKTIWRGEMAWLVRIMGAVLPSGWMDSISKSNIKLGEVERAVRGARREKVA